MSKLLGTLLISITLVVLGPLASAADYYGGPEDAMRAGSAPAAGAAKGTESYGESIGMKAGSGFANIALGWVEVPKNMIATSNQVNLAFGITGGLFKGLLHLIGRTLAGAVDVVTFPLPTKPIVQPEFVWENFDVETHYNPAFQLKD